MIKRKYTEFNISRRVNVSSTGHYSFRVSIKGYRGTRLWWDGYESFWTPTADPTFPKYVVQAFEGLLLKLLKADDTIYYENDQYGGERTTNLRYHDPDRIARWIERLEKELALLHRNETAK